MSPVSAAFAGTRPSGRPGGRPDGCAPVVEHTGRGPTGYEVTFRFRAPEAERVQIKGEWFFARPADLPQLAGTADAPTVEGQGLLPEEWQPGDVPLQHPNATSPNWPVADMRRRGDGVWTYTTPLPPGVFTYGFFVDSRAEDQSDVPQVFDPANPPWTVGPDEDQPRVQTSQVYVPSDPAFDTVDRSWQAPRDERGTLEHVTHPSPGHLTPADENYAVVYTPAGYDPERARPYPTLYLAHGGGENELGWSTQGALADIVDNLIDEGTIEPLVVVMPNATGFPDSTANAAYRADLIGTLIPWVEARYNVSPDPERRAFSGLSMGGMLTNLLMLHDTEEFGYYGMMSAGLPPGTTLSEAQVDALRKVSVFVGSGWQDVIHHAGYGSVHTGPAREVDLLTRAGVHVTTDFVNGGHEWFVWRTLLRDFLTRVAFLPLPFAPAEEP
ncbi:alpha/beta hydrolase-fold protein [Kineococcus arenarius]|uniref:alpha/beta hydrolase-fold protein n=1 Tax=unclassified Kineococcus TaxID=2621656 RepID=UPI003D7CF499